MSFPEPVRFGVFTASFETPESAADGEDPIADEPFL